MNINSSLTGTLTKDYCTTVSWRPAMNYAAAINDSNEIYLNDEREGGIIAHPMYATALTWPISGNIAEYIDSAKFPADIISRQVHFTEHIEFHRPVRPGDNLTIKGRIASIAPHRAGTHLIMRYDAYDKKGLPLFTEHTGAIARGVECIGGPSGISGIPFVPENPQSNNTVEAIIPISPVAPFIYDGCTDIFFPIHTSQKFARMVGLPGIILQGTATLAFAVKEIINMEAAGDPLRLKQIFCKFTGMVKPGTDIKLIHSVSSKKNGGKDIFFNVLNSEDERAISGGYADIL
jgi:acyl dehydratase